MLDSGQATGHRQPQTDTADGHRRPGKLRRGQFNPVSGAAVRVLINPGDTRQTIVSIDYDAGANRV